LAFGVRALFGFSAIAGLAMAFLGVAFLARGHALFCAIAVFAGESWGYGKKA
jgi:hypothetical protein